MGVSRSGYYKWTTRKVSSGKIAYGVLTTEWIRNLGSAVHLLKSLDHCGKAKLSMSYGDIFAQLNKNRMIIFNMASYDSSNLCDTTLVKSMEIRVLGNRNQEKWDILSHLEYQKEN